MSNNSNPSLLDAHQIVKRVYEEATDSVRVKQVAGVLVNEQYDAITVTYPTSSSEAYAFRSGGVSGTVVATVTVTYTSSAKTDLLTVVKT